ncbi:MAG: sulfite exporter TauE/SafE family protein [Methyloligellaceae bacterium]
MQVYLPIVEISVQIITILGMGGAVGFLSGMFGVGGGFLLTPLLIFSGIPPMVAVANGANQIVATSVSGAYAQWKRGNVDIRMGTILLIGGLLGSFLGVGLVKLLKQSGQVDLIIGLSYVIFLGTVGTIMLVESLNVIARSRNGNPVPHNISGRHSWMHGLPLKMRFHRSKLYISVIPPFVIGLFIGLLTAVMGVGGGFIMVPAMIYLLRVPTSVVVGTSLFQIVFVTAFVTVLHATQNHTIDIVLSFLLMVGGVIGAQFGVRAGLKLKGEQLRAILALLVLIVCMRMGYELIAKPAELFTISYRAGGG